MAVKGKRVAKRVRAAGSGKAEVVGKRRIAELGKPGPPVAGGGAAGVAVKVLAPVLEMCRPFASSRPLLPIMQHFCVRGGRIMATDGVAGIVAKLPVLLPEGTLPAEMLSKLLASFADDEEVRLSSAGDGKLRVEAGRYGATLSTYPVGDFPWLELPKDRKPVAADAFETLRRVRFCCVPEGDARPALGSVLFDAAGRGCATTGVTLAWRQSNVKKGTAGFAEGLVPGRLIERIEGWDAPTEWAVDPQGKLWLFFAEPERAVFSARPAAEFPDVAQVIEAQVAALAKAPGFMPDADGSFAAAVRRILLLAGDSPSAPVRLALDGGTLTLSASGTAEGCAGEAAERVAVKAVRAPKQPATVTVNGRFLLDAAERCGEFFLLDTVLAGFAEGRAFGHLVALMTG